MDLRVWECSSRCVRGMHAEHEYNRPPTDDELVGELVKRGVLKETKNDLGLFLFYALREPVGSVEGEG